MSHKLFHHSNLSNARIWDFLKQIDAACREAGCPRGMLHSASYPRKPYGLAADLRDDVRRLCCSVCRRRVKPPSVRFFGRRFYVGALFVLVSALSLAGGVRLETIARRIPSPTLRRWRRWWREEFLLTPEWAVKRGELAVPGEAPLRWLLRLIRGLQARLLRSLADAVDRVLRARCGAGFARRKRFCHERIGPFTPASPRDGEGGCRNGQEGRERASRSVGAAAFCGGASGLAAAEGEAAG